jgi:hypothetical protein
VTLQERVHDALRRFPKGARVAEIAYSVYDPAELQNGYKRCHVRVYKALRQLEGKGLAARSPGDYVNPDFGRVPDVWRPL